MIADQWSCEVWVGMAELTAEGLKGTFWGDSYMTVCICLCSSNWALKMGEQLCK